MSSPITLSGFNNIDFSVVVNAIMQQESQPLTAMQTQKTALEGQKKGFGTLASRLASLDSAVSNLTRSTSFRATATTVSDPTRLSVTADPAAATGSYQIYVDHLARAQAATSDQAFDDAATTIVAGAGTLVITGPDGPAQVTLAGDVTLQGLANAINATGDGAVSASVIRNTQGKYQLMLTGKETGRDNSFTIDASGAGVPASGSALSFTTAQAAQDAQIRVNGVTTTSATNQFTGAINGLSFSAFKEDAANPVSITISANYDSIVSMVQNLVSAFNDTTTWINQQTTAAASATSDGSSIGRDPFVRSLRTRLTGVITGDYSTGGTYGALAEVGFEFSRTGQLTFNDSKFRAALVDQQGNIEQLFRGSDGKGGVFGQMSGAIQAYTNADGLVPNATDRITDQLSRLSDRMDDMNDRLALRRAALQKEYAAADTLIAQLNSQKNSLSTLGSQYSLF